MKRFAAFAAVLALAACGTLAPRGRLGETMGLLARVEGSLPGSRIAPVRGGVVLAEWKDESGRPLHVLAADLERKELRFRASLARDRLDGGPEPLDALARRHGAFAALSMGHAEGGLSASGLTVIDRRRHFSPNPPRWTSIVIGRDNAVAIGKFHPDLSPQLDYDQALAGLWTLGDPEVEETLASAPWAMICRWKAFHALLWVYAPEGGSPEAAASRLACEEPFIASAGARAGLVVDGVSAARERGLALPAPRADSALLLRVAE